MIIRARKVSESPTFSSHDWLRSPSPIWKFRQLVECKCRPDNFSHQSLSLSVRGEERRGVQSEIYLAGRYLREKYLEDPCSSIVCSEPKEKLKIYVIFVIS